MKDQKLDGYGIGSTWASALWSCCFQRCLLIRLHGLLAVGVLGGMRNNDPVPGRNVI